MINKKIKYSNLNAKEKENFNFHKIASSRGCYVLFNRPLNAKNKIQNQNRVAHF
tara:strand:+ start:676 stop:837 length:162 start_codon:yes stop_codon:yes gene_type:complete